MKGIVFITTPGSIKRDFVNELHRQTDAVELVVIQRPKKAPFLTRLKKFYSKVGLVGLLPELYYFVRMQLSSSLRAALTVTKGYTRPPHAEEGYIPPILEVDDINSEEVHTRLQDLHPHIIAIWGGSIIKPHIISTADHVFNIHTGYCPFYRGTNCNLNAILRDDREHIGITLHRVVPLVDAGEIYKVLSPHDFTQSWGEIFKQLNDEAFSEYLALIQKVWRDEPIETYPQDLSKGKNYLLKDWTYQHQYKAARKVLQSST